MLERSTEIRATSQGVLSAGEAGSGTGTQMVAGGLADHLSSVTVLPWGQRKAGLCRQL